MEVKIIRHYSYKLVQRVYVKKDNETLEEVKNYIDKIITSDKEDVFLTFAEYYIFLDDKDGFRYTYYKEISLGKNLKKTLDNLPVIKDYLLRLQKISKVTPNVKIEVSSYQC